MWNGRYHTRPHRKWNGYNFITAICNGHAPNGTKCPFCCNGYVNGCGRWPKWQKPTVLFLNGFFFGVGIFTVKKGCCILQTFWRPNEHARSVWCVISVRLLRSCGPSGSPLKYGGWYIYIYIYINGTFVFRLRGVNNPFKDGYSVTFCEFSQRGKTINRVAAFSIL